MFFFSTIPNNQIPKFNKDSDGNPILTQAELGKLVRNSGRLNAQNSRLNQQHAAATRNLYNRQQPLQYAPSHNKRSNSYGSDGFNGGYGAASNGRSNQNNADDEDGDSSSPFNGANFGSSFDNGNDGENEGSNNEGGQAMNLNQAASGYPGQGDYNNDAGVGNGFGFGGSSGYGPSSNDGADFGPSEFGGEGRRAKSASSPMGARGYGSDEDAGAPLYGPNSAVNGDNDDEGRAGYSPDGGNDNENDDE